MVADILSDLEEMKGAVGLSEDERIYRINRENRTMETWIKAI